jgi:hypothetical protein
MLNAATLPTRVNKVVVKDPRFLVAKAKAKGKTKAKAKAKVVEKGQDKKVDLQ